MKHQLLKSILLGLLLFTVSHPAFSQNNCTTSVAYDVCDGTTVVPFPDNHCNMSEIELHPGGSSGYNLSGDGFHLLHDEGQDKLKISNQYQSAFLDCANQPKQSFGYEVSSVLDCTPISDHGATATVSNHPYKVLRELNSFDHNYTNDNVTTVYRGSAPLSTVTTFDDFTYDAIVCEIENNGAVGSFRVYTFGQLGYQHIHNNYPEFMVFSTACNNGTQLTPLNNGTELIPQFNWSCDNTPNCVGNIVNCGFTGHKNYMIVGTDGDIGSIGPTDNGRIKPDFVHSPSRTSYSTPRVAGCGVLLREQWANYKSGVPQASTIKALLAHTGDEVEGNVGVVNGIPQFPFTYPIPSFQKGYGLVNVKRAADLIAAASCTTSIHEPKFIAYNNYLSNGNGAYPSSTTYPSDLDGSVVNYFGVGSINTNIWSKTVYSDGTNDLKVTMSWHEYLDTYPATGSDGEELDLSFDYDVVLNNLNLRVEMLDLSGNVIETILPWVLDPSDPAAPPTKGIDDLNNIEQVLVEAPTPGYYRVVVDAPSDLFMNMDQVCSVIIDGMTPIEQGISFDLKVYLEGPASISSTSLMSTDLSQNNWLPTAHSYNHSPYYFSGCGKSSISSNDIVDWLLVELRLANDFNTLIDQRAVLLRNDGVILNPDGSPGVIFPNAEEDVSYRVVVRHRNHLDVISTGTVISPCVVSYDFTDDQTKAHGPNGLKLVGSNYAMLAGDVNGDLNINTLDFVVWQTELTNLGYYLADFTLDGNVNVVDLQPFLDNSSLIGATEYNAPGFACSTACTPEILNESRFTNGWDYWNDGGNHCWRSSGLKKAVIRRWGRFTSDPFDLSDKTDVEIAFDLQALNMDVATDDIYIEVSFNGGSTYSVVSNLKYGIDFQNSQITAFTLPILGTYSNDVVFRFRSHNNTNNEHFRIDNIVVTGCSGSGKTEQVSNDPIEDKTVAESSIAVLYDHQNIWFQCEELKIDQFVEYQIYDLNGRLHYAGKSDQNTWQLDAQTLNKGMYLIVSTCGSEKFILR